MFTDSPAIIELSKTLDLKRFLIIRLIPEILDKLLQLSQIIKEWLNADENFLLSVRKTIGEKRKFISQKKLSILSTENIQNELLKHYKIAQLQSQNSKHKFEELNVELNMLAAQIKSLQNEKDMKTSRITLKKQSIVRVESGKTHAKNSYAVKVKIIILIENTNSFFEWSWPKIVFLKW